MPTLNEALGVVAEVNASEVEQDESNFDSEEDLSMFDEFEAEPEPEDKYSHLPLLKK